MTDPGQTQTHSWRWIRIAAILLYLSLSLATILTREPWCDEAWFSSPGLTLATRGYLGTPYLDEAGNIGRPPIRLDGINRHTYWMPPLYMVTQAGWIKLAGFGLTRVRIASLLWGLAAMLAWSMVATKLTGRVTASLMLLLLAGEYGWIYASADARMEMMCAALGTTGLAFYLHFREHSLSRALVLANSAIAASALTHPMGVSYFVALAVMILAADRAKLTLAGVAMSAAPYLVALTAWGLYIAQAPQLFLIQFTGNSSARGPGLTHPLAALGLELTHRYGESFGLAAWTSGPARIKILVLLLYAGGLIYVSASRRLRSAPGILLGWLAACSVLIFFWLLEGSKNSLYLPHILPWLSLLAAIAVLDVSRGSLRTAALFVLPILGVQILSTAMPARRNTYAHLYQPAMNFLQEHGRSTDTIMADAAIGFDLGFDRRVTDDPWLGYLTGKKLDWIVITPVYASLIESMPQFHPDVYRHVTQLLNGYTLAFQNDSYKIYQRTVSPSESTAAGSLPGTPRK
jgi:4-amino-4-deoxy-L-arabinose transferase-like glycosyltransferase